MAVQYSIRTLSARKKLPSVKYHFHNCRRRKIWLWSVTDCIFLTCSMWNILRCRFLFPVFVYIDRSMIVNLSCWNRTSSESCGIYPENNSLRYSLTFVNSGARECRFKVFPTIFSQLFHVIHDCASLFTGARWHDNPDHDRLPEAFRCLTKIKSATAAKYRNELISSPRRNNSLRLHCFTWNFTQRFNFHVLGGTTIPTAIGLQTHWDALRKTNQLPLPSITTD